MTHRDSNDDWLGLGTHRRVVRRSKPSGLAALLVGAFVATSVITTAAKAADSTQLSPSKKTCSQKYVDAQHLRSEGKLVEAKQALVVCAQDACPAVLRKDCVQWLDDVDKALPTVVLGVRDPSGNDLMDARITVDGKVIDDALDGRAIDVDPGKRKFVIEAKGWMPVERMVIIRQGEKNRLLTFEMKHKKKEKQKKKTASVSSHHRASSSGGMSQKTWALVAGGVGVVGLGVGGYFGYAAAQRWSVAEDHCDASNRCDAEGVEASDDAHRDALMSDIFFGVGVVGLGVGTYLWLSDDSDEQKRSAAEAAHIQAGVRLSDSAAALTLFGLW